MKYPIRTQLAVLVAGFVLSTAALVAAGVGEARVEVRSLPRERPTITGIRAHPDATAIVVPRRPVGMRPAVPS